MKLLFGIVISVCMLRLLDVSLKWSKTSLYPNQLITSIIPKQVFGASLFSQFICNDGFPEVDYAEYGLSKIDLVENFAQ